MEKVMVRDITLIYPRVIFEAAVLRVSGAYQQSFLHLHTC